MTTLEALDIDDIDTWPANVASAVTNVLMNNPNLAGVEYADELNLSDADVEAIEEEAAGLAIVLYHATRLTREEMGWIRAEGLLPLTPELISKRVAALLNAGLIPLELATDLLQRSAGDAVDPYRGGRVCLTTSSCSLRRKVFTRHLFGTWGGEAIYGNFEEKGETHKILSVLGEPSIIQIRMILFSERVRYLNFALAQSLVGVSLGLRMAGSVFVDRVKPDEILAIVTPDDPNWAKLNPMSEP